MIDADDVHPAEEKVLAIRETPAPRDKEELQAFLGIVSFYSSFLKNRTQIAEHFYRLLDKKANWMWSTAHEAAF